ncbi:MAG: FAD-linked oxidase C-terminal domain-containing protein [Nitrososphaerota archaeon]|nr:FAD-linked oxidase C-terminal domain-containing protein [Nitrososphaerota archaeon]
MELGGVIAGEHGIGLARKSFIEAQHGNALQVMRMIKRAIDPNNIMNPGKIFD